MYRKRRSTAAIGMKWSLLVVALAHLSLIAAQAVSEYPPEILSQPAAGQIETIGRSKTLQCQALANPSPYYSWVHDGAFVSQNQTMGIYRLQNLQEADAGKYRCLAANSRGAELSKAAELKVAALRNFTATASEIVGVDQGKSKIIPLPSIDTLSLVITWEEDNVPLSEEDIFHIITLDFKLVLLSIDTNQNAKQYRAKAVNFNANFESVSSPYVLQVREDNSTDNNNPSTIPPEIVVPPVDTFARLGTDAILECIINARPMRYLSIKWYKLAADGTKGLALEVSNTYFLTTYQRRLYVRQVAEEDSGTYLCEGQLDVIGDSSIVPITSASANLTVQVEPLLKQNLQTKVVSKDFSMTAVLQCEADKGVPEPSLAWFFNGVPISNTAKRTVFSNGSLEITSLDLPDAGKYQCFAKNDAGEDYIAVTLRVNSAPPQINKAPENLTIVEEKDARFFCEVTGAPTPEITWTKVVNGAEVAVVFGGRIQKIRSHLLIATVQKEDSGVYKCFAANIKGNQSAQAQLTVITKTQIIRPPQDQTVILSTQVRFECGVTQDENTVPVWEWFFYKDSDTSKEQQLGNSGRYRIQGDGTLIFSGVSAQDIGLYKCHVISTGGNDSRTASLNVIDLPRPPTITSVTLNPNENNSVNIVWNKMYDGNSPLTKYIITYRQENPNGNNDGVAWEVYPENVPPAESSHVVSSLQASRYYRFRISAVNTVGEGNASNPMPNPAIKMPTQPPSTPPRNFFCTQGGEKEVVATWDPPEESTWNGDLQGYVLRYKVANLPDSTIQETRVPGATQRAFTIQYLVSFRQYAVSIGAYNEEGTGAVSNPFYVWTREGRPTDPPQHVTVRASNSTTVILEWDPPDAGNINGLNLGYMIEIRRNASLVRSFFVSSDPANMEGRQVTEIYDLGKFTEYSLIVACRTSPGLGPYSPAVSVKTQEDVPGPVHDLKFDQVRDRSVRVTWFPPSEVNGVLTGYVLEYEKKNLPATRVVRPLPASQTRDTVVDLIPVTNYTIYVTAKTKIGQGRTVSADIESGVPPELPHPPYNLGYSNIGARKVLLQFFPGFDGKTSITKWIVLAHVVGGESPDFEEIYSISAPTAREIWVENLKPYTKYQLKLKAENIVGQSTASDPTREFETQQAPPGVPPGNVTVRPLNSTAFRISWTPIPRQEWNGVPRGYRIDYRMWSSEEADEGVQSVHESAWTTVQLENGINMDSFILLRLQEWMDYQIRMISYNDVDTSSYSSVTTARTREATPSASPTNLAANPVSSTEILVTWAAVPRLEQNGQILGYKVLYRPTDNSDTPVHQKVEGNDTLNATLSGLRKYVSYMIQVLAYTRMGDGVLSSHKVRRTDEDVPGPPVIIYFPNVTYTSAVIIWGSPEEPNGIITSYRVYYSQRDTPDPQQGSELGPNIFQYAVTGLERETYYIFSVTAKTRLGWGTPASVPVLTMVNRDRPEQPRKPTVGSLQIHARNITIAWQPGTDNYSPVRNFTIQYKMRDQGWTVFPQAIPPSANSYTVTGLRPNSHYSFQVAATNDIGKSDFSQASKEVQTQSDKPDGAPQNLKVVALTRTSIRASWQAPAEGTWNGVLVNYVLQFRQVQQQDFREVQVTLTATSHTLTNLVISQTYEVQVLAVNAKGRGPASTPATIYVGEAAPTASPSNVQVFNKSSSSIEVTWVAPPPETQNGGLSGYKVLFYKNSSRSRRATGDPQEEQRISAETHMLLEGLETFSFYFVSVQAYNLAGEGPRSGVVMARTSEGVPGAPGPLQFSNITMRQVTVTFTPPSTPNGNILLYEMEYYRSDNRQFGTLPPKRVLRANETLVVVTGLEEEVSYQFRVSANTSIGRGVPSEDFITTGPQSGSPKPPSKPSVIQEDRDLLLTWSDGAAGTSPTYGYFIQKQKQGEAEFLTLQQETKSVSRATVALTNLNPNTQYRFRVIAINDHGISRPSVASDTFLTPSFAVAQVAKPFHTEWWFLVIIALTGVIVILVIISLLCLLTRRKKADQEMKRSQTSTTVMSEPSEPEEGGFPTYELRQSRRTTQPRNGSIKNIYARAPPRPSPASVAYSDDDDAMSMAKPPIPDDSSSCVTDKPSDLDDSTEPSDDESDAESEKVPASPPPPPFPSEYANSEQRRSWRFPNQSQPQNQNQNNAYAYTDSEADSNHYAFSLNNGQLVVNNVAGARTPLTGFSSFV